MGRNCAESWFCKCTNERIIFYSGISNATLNGYIADDYYTCTMIMKIHSFSLNL
jgi:hypothetical protein